MGVKIKRVCDRCLIEEKEEFFINREDIKGARKCIEIGYMVDWLCLICKKNKKLLGESVDPTIEGETENGVE
jgi:macrodomain Ter protein organizer (MatP/YcbG family)